MLWTAPELLRLDSLAPRYGTPSGDVYSFAIILQELLYRTSPFFDLSSSPQGTDTMFSVAAVVEL